MIKKQNNNLDFLGFSLFEKEKDISYGIFTRDGGVSKSPFDSLNVSYDIGDMDTNVKKNRNLILKSLNIKELFFIEQVHKDTIFILDKKTKKNKIKADAMISNLKNIGLVIQTADCQAILLYDKKEKIIAAIHSGWRSSILNIIGKTIAKMQFVFNSNPSNIIAGISPSIGVCCAEFINYKKDFPKNLWRFQIKKNHFDFWEISRNQLQNSGIKNENIETSNICTKCNSKDFFSYRKEKRTGRLASVISLRPLNN